jgi:hypothetical protein
MRNNFHSIKTTIDSLHDYDINNVRKNIKAIINNSHNFIEVVYGINEYVASLFRQNNIRVQNSFSTIMTLKSKIKEQTFQIGNSFIFCAREIFKPKINEIKINNDIHTKLHIYERLEESALQVYNSFIIYIRKVINSEHTVYVKNSIEKQNLDIPFCIEENNKIVVMNSDIDIQIRQNGQYQETELKIENNNVNAAAWYFTRLETMSGSINNYYYKTIEATGRTKVV